MSVSNDPCPEQAAAISEHDVDEQVSLLCKPRNLPEKRGKLLAYLIGAQRRGDFELVGGRRVLIQFEERENLKGKTYPNAQAEQAYQRARQVARDLRLDLERYYRELVPNAPDCIKIMLPEHRGPSADAHAYQPQITRRNPTTPSADARFWLVGDNVQALEYVTDRISKLNRIEETFVRWTEKHSSLYAGSAFRLFVEKLKASRLLYRAVFGPMTDSAVFEKGGLREVLASRVVKDLPNGETATKLYRLLHGTALMNFTLLYFFEDEGRFFKRTSHIEVLFGYGVHEEYGGPDTTVVFGSDDPRLVKEFQKHFDALRDERFSRPLDLGQPALFRNQPWGSDVLVTFPKLPSEELERKTRASGTGDGWTDKSRMFGLGPAERQDNYVPGRPHIKICVSALKLLASKPFRDELKSALARNVQVSITLWAPESSFIDLRTKAIGLDPEDARHELESAFLVAKHLGKHKNLFIRRCTAPMGSVSILWIDEFIYFSPYWVGKDVADGPHFLVMADSATGVEIRDQYDQMIAASGLED